MEEDFTPEKKALRPETAQDHSQVSTKTGEVQALGDKRIVLRPRFSLSWLIKSPKRGNKLPMPGGSPSNC